MGTYRHVQTGIWQDTFYLSLCPHDKLFHTYMITNGKSTQCGIFEQSTKIMAFELGYSEKIVQDQIKRFIEMGKIHYDPKTNEFFLSSWLKYNFSTSPSVIACMLKETKKVKSKELMRFWIQCVQSVYSVWGKEKEKQKEKEVKKENCKKKNKARASGVTFKNLSTQEEKKDPLDERPSQIISYLNQKTGSRFRVDTKSICGLIWEKLGKGYGVEDFYTVIDKKTSEWMGTAMAPNLTPYTLFTTRFDDYLNQSPQLPKNRCSNFHKKNFTKVA